MKIKEAIKIWIKDNEEIIAEMKDFKSDEYKTGLAEGLEIALDSLKAYLSECEDY